MRDPDLSRLDYLWAPSMHCGANLDKCGEPAMLVSDRELVLTPAYLCEYHLLKIAVWVERLRYWNGE